MKPKTLKVVLAQSDSAGLLGQGEYERQLTSELELIASLNVKVAAIRPMRGRNGGRRVPLRFLTNRSLATQRRLSSAIYGRSDLVHRMDARLPAASNELLTIHDVAPLRFADEGAWPATGTASAMAARLVLVPSVFAGNEVRSALGCSNVHVIPYGVDAEYFATGGLLASDHRAIPALKRRYVVCASGSSNRKNLAALSEAWKIFTQSTAREDVELLICGPPSEQKTSLFGSLRRCRILGLVERSQLRRLVSDASALVVPSLYEGFGLPVLEGMAAGTTVVSARTSSLIEVGGDAAIFVEPTADGIARGLASALDEPSSRRIDSGRRWAQRFTWRACAQRHAEIYQRAAS